jgi:predicted hydrocarbon binding protein
VDASFPATTTGTSARIRGRVLSNAQRFVVDQFGEDGWKAVLDHLPNADAETLAGVVSVGWYDIGLYDRVHEAIHAVLGARDARVMDRLGRYCAEHDLTTVHRVFFRMANPAFLIEKHADYWRRYQDTGDWTIVRERDTRVRATLSGWGSRSEASCSRLAAYVGRMVELIGQKNVRVTRARCRARGDAVCELVLEWA